MNLNRKRPAGYILFARMKVMVIIPAAGLGTRMTAAPGEKTRKPAATKQFAELQGVPILLRTLDKFAGEEQVTEIRVAVRKNEIAPFRERLEREMTEVARLDHRRPATNRGG